MKLYMNLPHFIFVCLVNVTVWNFILTFFILSLCIWWLLPCETLSEPFDFYFHVNGFGYPMKFYTYLLPFILIWSVADTLWNFIWTSPRILACFAAANKMQRWLNKNTFCLDTFSSMFLPRLVGFYIKSLVIYLGNLRKNIAEK